MYLVNIIMALQIHLEAPNGRQIVLPTGLFINNQFVASISQGKITSINPRYVLVTLIVIIITQFCRSDETEIASVEAASGDDVDAAVRAARAAFDSEEWSEISNTDRGAIMYKFADLIEENRETLATLEAWDNGKPYKVALEEDVAEVILTMRYYAGWADKIYGQTIPVAPQKLAYTLKQPIGVCGQIIPWNYPLSMAAWKLGPAIACGNTVVMKPAEQTPLSILFLATLIPAAGFPPGVINIINGLGREAGAALVSHPGVDKIAFTGSTLTGKAVMKAASTTMKNITLETGGKSPLLVFKDANIEQAAKWAHVGIMSNQGQICTATSRVLVHQDVFDDFISHFITAVAQHKIGHPFDEDTFQGPQITKAQFQRVLDYIETGKRDGAKLIAGGNAFKNVGSGKGFFIEPTIFTNVREEMRIFQEEVFGPFVSITTFSTEVEAIRLANNTSYGLGSAVFTTDLERAHRVAARLEAGMVWINSSNDSDIRVPFGGVKQSGIGRELGEAGLAAYTQTKAIHINMGMLL